MKHRYVIPAAIIAMSFGTAWLANAQGSAAVGNNSGAAGTNNTSPGTTGSGNAPAERMGGSTAMGNPGASTTPGPASTGLGTAATAPNAGAPAAGTPAAGDNKDANNNAVSTAPQNNPGAPVSGANSFTEGQARGRIEDRGFSQVTDLKLDSQGVWRAKAMHDGKSVEIAMDYQGNVVAK